MLLFVKYLFFTYSLIDLQVTFEYDGPMGRWSKTVLNLEVHDQTVSFLTPYFPCVIDKSTPVHIILKQEHRNFQPLTFNYIPKSNKTSFFGLNSLLFFFSAMPNLSTNLHEK